MTKIACIDIGTVTVRLGIFDADVAPVHLEIRHSTICNLGKGFTDTGNLMPDAIERVLFCIDEYLNLIRAYGAHKVCCILTAAARESNNVEPLLEGLSQRGLIAQVIGGKTEGSLTFFGVCQDFPDKRVLAVDNGGGSTELTVGRFAIDDAMGYRTPEPEIGSHGKRVPMVERVMSMSIGCRRVSDRFDLYPCADKMCTPHTTSIEEARAYAHERFAYAVNEEGILWLEPEVMVACGGTPTSLVAMKKELVPYDAKKVHLENLSLDDIETLIERMSKMSLAELEAWPGLQPKRAQVILSGGIILAELMRAMHFSSFIVSESDLLVGLAICAAAEHTGDFIPLPWKPGLAEI